MEQKNDILYLKYILNFGKLLGIFPMYLNSKKCSTCYSLLIIIIYLIYMCCSFVGRKMLLYNGRISQRYVVIDVLQSTNELIFVLVLIYQSIRNYETWIALLKHIQKLDQSVLMSRFSTENTPKLRITVALFLTVCLYISLNLLDCLYNEELRWYYYIYLFTNINDFYITVVTAFIAFILNKRICCLNKIFLDMVSSKVIWIVTEKELDDIVVFYKQCARISHMFNKIFGWPIFLYIPATSLAILSCLDVTTSSEFKYYSAHKVSILFSINCFFAVSINFYIFIHS